MMATVRELSITTRPSTRTLARPRPYNGYAATAPHRACEPPVALSGGYSLVQTSALASTRAHRRRMLRSFSHSLLVHTRRHPDTGVANRLAADSSPARLPKLGRIWARPRPPNSHPATAPHRACEPPVALCTWVHSCAYVRTCQFPCTQEEDAVVLRTEPPRAHTPPFGYWCGEPLGFTFRFCRVPNMGRDGGTEKRGLRSSGGLRQA
jgi:hypothetical protein